MAGALRLGGVREKRQHPSLSQLCELLVVRVQPVDRARVQLEVPGVDNGPHRRLDAEPDPIDNRVGDTDRLTPEVAKLEALSGMNDSQCRLVGELMLSQPILDKRDREWAAVYRHRDLTKQIRQGADV